MEPCYKCGRFHAGDCGTVHTGSTTLAIELNALKIEHARLLEQSSHADAAIEELTKEREEYRMRWLGSMTPDDAALIRAENARLLAIATIAAVRLRGLTKMARFSHGAVDEVSDYLDKALSNDEQKLNSAPERNETTG